MLATIWRRLEGSVTITVDGRSPERFINLAMSQGIYPWDIQRLDGSLVCSVPAKSFRSLRHIARASNCRIRVMSKTGIPFMLFKARRRRMFLFGALLCLGAVYAMSSAVWFIEVTGIEEIPLETVLEAARSEGLTPGALRHNLDIDEIRESMVLKIPGVSWVGIRQKGTLLIIEIVEKTLHPDPSLEEQPGPIVAKKDSLLVELLALRGVAASEVGKTVRRGEVVIEADPESGVSRGVVKAKCWYQGYAEFPFSRETRESTGRTSTSYVLNWKDREIMRLGRPRFGHFEPEVRPWNPPFWRNLNLPVEFLSITYHEIRVIREAFGREIAKREAMNAALSDVREALPPGAERSDIWAEVVDEGSDFITVRVTVETVEDIAARPDDI